MALAMMAVHEHDTRAKRRKRTQAKHSRYTLKRNGFDKGDSVATLSFNSIGARGENYTAQKTTRV